MSSADEISTNDTQFIIECLKNLEEDRLINLNKVAKTLGYSNVFSAGNRLRSLRNRYGFANFEGKTVTGKTVAGETPGAPAPAPVPPSKRGRPRIKNVAPIPKGDVAVEVTNKRKREDDNNNNDNNEENNGDVPEKTTRRGRKPASTTTTTATDSEATTNGHVHGLGKTTTFRAVHFPRFPTPSKRLKKQAEMTTTDRRQLETPSRRIFRIAAQTIGRARSEQRRLLNGENMRSGLKLVFKLQV
ncbi:hypothetical protein SI65_09256 [Aspergillus cristatus]|uniref:Uncharacterized protein n=1 Tax=Aspergillus cristatus TaxID=573508 RepID=A0A1E3B2X5_ASPCR|nr:hypothetical protein SI65_09256 [Aspergillus cristatus]